MNEHTTSRKPHNAKTFYHYKHNNNQLKYNHEIESHLSFSRFMLYMPDNQLNKFKWLYLANTHHSIPSYFIKQRTNYFLFFFNLNFHHA